MTMRYMSLQQHHHHHHCTQSAELPSGTGLPEDDVCKWTSHSINQSINFCVIAKEIASTARSNKSLKSKEDRRNRNAASFEHSYNATHFETKKRQATSFKFSKVFRRTFSALCRVLYLMLILGTMVSMTLFSASPNFYTNTHTTAFPSLNQISRISI